MAYPASSQPKIRPAPDFFHGDFTRSCRHAKHESSFDGRPIRPGKPPSVQRGLAYDEYAGGIRAKEVFDALVRDRGELFQFICHLWKFEVLPEQRLFDVAAQDAARADMIVLAIRQSQELSAQVGRWTEHWLPSKQADSRALVVLQGGQAVHVGSNTTVGATLRQLDEGDNVQVFCKEIAWSAMDSHFAVQITKRQLREEPRGLEPLPSPYAGQPGWSGLNE